MNKIQFVTTTSTFANKGKETLKYYGINSEVKKVSGGTAAGCLFGITVSASDSKKAESLLRDSGVRIVAVKEVMA